MKKGKTIFSLFMVVALLAVFVGGPLVQRADAANLNYAYLMPNDMTVSQTSGVSYFLALNFPTANMTNPTITLTYPSGETAWCTTAGDLTVTGDDTAPVSQGSWTAQDPSVTFSSATCTSGATDTLEFTVTGTLNHSTTYGFQIVEDTAALGTDSATGEHLVNVSISASGTTHELPVGVPLVTDGTVTLDADVAEAPSVTCTISDVTHDFGILYQNGAFVTQTHDIVATPNDAAAGYYWVAYGENGGLFSSTASPNDTIASSGTTVNLTTGEGFGFDASVPATGGTVVTNFGTGDGAGIFGGVLDGLSNARMFLHNTSATAEAHTSTITYGARATVADAADDYQEVVTFVCGGYY